MLRSDGTPFDRETERTRWEYVDQFETDLLRKKNIQETVQEFLYLCAQGVSNPVEDNERAQYLMDMQRRLRALGRPARSSDG